MDHSHPDITAPEGGAGGETLEGAVRERILRLHPLGGYGGLAGRVMRKASGWEEAGSFAAEVMSRFRSPFAVTPMAMPLALPAAESRIPATDSVSVAATPSAFFPDNQRPLPVVGSSPSGTVAAGSLVQRKVMGGADSTPSTQSTGTVAEPVSISEKLAEGFHENTAGSDNYKIKADVSSQLKSPPTAAGTWAMTERLHGTLGARLVQRHSTFAGTSAEKDAVAGSPFSIQKMPLTAGESSPLARANEAMGRTSQRRASSEIAAGESTVGNADKVPAVTPAVGAAPFVRPPLLKQQREGVSTSPKTAVVQLRKEPSASSLPLVKPTPTATATIQRKVSPAALADDIFARLPNPSFEGASPPLPLATSVVASAGAAMECLSSSSMPISSGGDFPAAAASAAVLSPAPKGFSSVGGALGQGSLPVIPRSPSGGGASGIVSRKAKTAVTGPELSWGGLRSGASETAGAVLYPRTGTFSPPLPTVAANSSGSALSAALPLTRMQGMAGSGVVGSIQRKLSDSTSVMQRAETAGASASATPAGGTSESAAGFSLGASPETGALTPTPGASVDLEQVADEVYRIIERRLIVEKENRGL